MNFREYLNEDIFKDALNKLKRRKPKQVEKQQLKDTNLNKYLGKDITGKQKIKIKTDNFFTVNQQTYIKQMFFWANMEGYINDYKITKYSTEGDDMAKRSGGMKHFFEVDVDINAGDGFLKSMDVHGNGDFEDFEIVGK